LIRSANPAVNKLTALEIVQGQIECCLESIDFELRDFAPKISQTVEITVNDREPSRACARVELFMARILLVNNNGSPRARVELFTVGRNFSI
jgi:hypothetical protein